MKPIRVAFLGLYFEAWDALDPVFQAMKADSRFEPIAVSMPRKLTGQLKYAEEDKVHTFYTELGIEHLRILPDSDQSDARQGLELLRRWAPDYVFTNYPWQRNYPPSLRFDRLVEFTRLAYVPYFSLAMVDEPDDEPGGGQAGSPVATHLYTQRVHQLASLVFTQDSNVVKAHALTERGGSNLYLTGSPKIDSLRALAETGAGSWPLAGNGFKIVWAPHHSYSSHWLNFGLFSMIKDQMLELARNRSDLEIVLRPHPFLWGTLVDRGVISSQELESWRKNWDFLANTAVHEEGSYAELFLATDVLITDGISFLGEYPLVTGKPAFFIENPQHWQFSPIGQLAAETSIRLSGFEQLVAAIDAAIDTKIPDRSLEIQKLVEASSPVPGQASRLILEVVLEDFGAPTGPSKLVDPAQIKSVPWELVAGREPFED